MNLSPNPAEIPNDMAEFPLRTKWGPAQLDDVEIKCCFQTKNKVGKFYSANEISNEYAKNFDQSV